jgi:hypothetical protein
MVAIHKENSMVTFEVKGFHKLWAFRNKITVLEDNIISVRQDADVFKSAWKGVRLLGTSIPFIFAAGVFLQKGKKVFWDVFKKKSSIVVELKDSCFSRLIIEVENPEEAMRLLSK